MAIEDNAAGYDILSYDVGPVEPTSRLIEVKSSMQNPPRIILTRKEWEAAARYSETYVFHIWSLLLILSIASATSPSGGVLTGDGMDSRATQPASFPSSVSGVAI